ncbi:MAG: signal peptidase II [Syntrophus sp. (in: bacteria)]|nr:signal peptidase II [Syntrophus sp. (in: bacteria)]
MIISGRIRSIRRYVKGASIILNKKYILLGVTTGVIVILDQITKLYVDATMRLHESIPVIQGLFSITHVRNPGAAFGFLADASPLFRAIFFVAVTVLAIVLVLHYIWKSRAEEQLLTFALSLILSGAVGNLIDRVRFGEVIDFLDVYIGSTHWPAFNVADSAISVGAVILLIEIMRGGKNSRTDAKRK